MDTCALAKVTWNEEIRKLQTTRSYVLGNERKFF